MKIKKIFMRLPLFFMGVFLVVANSCDKDDNNNVPVLSTTEVTEITANTATSGGNISEEGGTTVTARGVCWSTNENPTIDDSKTEDGTGVGSFASSITGLEPNTTYFVRAYATNSAGTGYGSAMSFTTHEGSSVSTFTDPRDGKVYQTVVIGDQEWMAENLAYEPSNGNFWVYDNHNANVETYGYLYDWQTAMNVCPTGWHLPSDNEWSDLIDFLGCYEIAGGKLKATGTIEEGTGLWHDPNTGATNDTDFTALPGGVRETDGSFNYGGDLGSWWSATSEEKAEYAWNRSMHYFYSNVYNDYSNNERGISVRCIRD